MPPFSDPLLSVWENGSFGEKAIYPVDCVTSILDNESIDDNLLAVLNTLTVGYSALKNGGFQSSQTVIVNGATGNIGAGVVVLALAMEASKVIAVGRDKTTLDELKQLDKRVIDYQLKDDLQTNVQLISSLSEERNLLIDMSSANTHIPTLSCIQSLSYKGTAVFVGGVQAEIPIPYGMMLGKELTIKGSFMFQRNAPAEILRMIGSGLLDLSIFKYSKYTLDQVNDAIQFATTCKGLSYCVVIP